MRRSGERRRHGHSSPSTTPSTGCASSPTAASTAVPRVLRHGSGRPRRRRDGDGDRQRIGVEDVDDSPMFAQSALDVLDSRRSAPCRPPAVRPRRSRVVGVLSTHIGFRGDWPTGSPARRSARAPGRRSHRASHAEQALSKPTGPRTVLAMLGHELRNPLARSPTPWRARPVRSARHAARSATSDHHAASPQLTRLVDDLLDVNRLVAGKMDLGRVPVNLEALAKQCLSTIALPERLRERSLSQSEPAWVEGDPALLEQVRRTDRQRPQVHPQGGRIGDDPVRGPEASSGCATRAGDCAELLPHSSTCSAGPSEAGSRRGRPGPWTDPRERLVEMQRNRPDAPATGRPWPESMRSACRSWRTPGIPAGGIAGAGTVPPERQRG